MPVFQYSYLSQCHLCHSSSVSQFMFSLSRSLQFHVSHFLVSVSHSNLMLSQFSLSLMCSFLLAQFYVFSFLQSLCIGPLSVIFLSSSLSLSLLHLFSFSLSVILRLCFYFFLLFLSFSLSFSFSIISLV
jgi:hypothetical protein